MQKFKSLSNLLFEQNPANTGEPDLKNFKAAVVTADTKDNTTNSTKPINNKGKGKGNGTDNTKPETQAAPTEDTSYKTKEPYASLIKLPGANGIEEGSGKVVVGDQDWPHAIIWESSGGESYDPTAKAPIKTDKYYIFKTHEAGDQKVNVSWRKSQNEKVFPLYSGSYSIAGGKLTITGLGSQKEVIDISSGKFDSTNVAVIPSTQAGFEKELARTLAVFSRQKFNASSYSQMRLFNLKRESPELYKLLKEALTKKGYPLFNKTTTWFLDQNNMTVNVSFFKNRTDKMWPIAAKFYSHYASNLDPVGFGTITDISKPIHVDVNKGKRDFTSGYEYLSYKLEGATGVSKSTEHGEGTNTIFSDEEAYAFFAILCGLNRASIEKLISETAAFGVKFPGGLTWEATVLDQIISGWAAFYNSTIKGLQISNGKEFTQESLVKGKDTVDEEWFNSLILINSLGGDYLKKALETIPNYTAPSDGIYVAM